MNARGFSMIELMIVVAIAAALLAVALPSFQTSLNNSRTRGAAESIYNGLLLARSESIKRNAPVRFQLVSTMTTGCALDNGSVGKGLWVDSQYVGTNSRGVVTGLCGTTPVQPDDQEEPCSSGTAIASCATNPFITAKSAATVPTGVTVSASASPLVVTFGPLGQLLDNLEGAKPTTSPAYSVTVSPSGGSGRSWKVQVKANGGVQVCDPNAASTDNMRCT